MNEETYSDRTVLDGISIGVKEVHRTSQELSAALADTRAMIAGLTVLVCAAIGIGVGVFAWHARGGVNH